MWFWEDPERSLDGHVEFLLAGHRACCGLTDILPGLVLMRCARVAEWRPCTCFPSGNVLSPVGQKSIGLVDTCTYTCVYTFTHTDTYTMLIFRLKR